jgi:hypothetical protein
MLMLMQMVIVVCMEKVGMIDNKSNFVEATGSKIKSSSKMRRGLSNWGYFPSGS